MNKFFVILFHTYLTKLKSKSFIITTIVTLLFMYGFLNFDRIIQMFQSEDETNVIVIDQTNELFQGLEENLRIINERIQLERFSGTIDEGIERVKSEEVDGLLIVNYDEEQLPIGTYHAMTIVEQSVPVQIEQALQTIKQTLLTERLNIDEAEIAEIFAPVSFEKIALDESAKSEHELNQARVFVYILLFIIYFTVILYGNMIATEIAIEKSSRVMEILISSSSPIQQMFGKICGIALLGLTQYVLIFGVGFYSFLQRIKSESFAPEIGDVIVGEGLPIHLIGYAILYFILGYFLYATIAAMLGSLVSRIEEVNQVMTPMVLLIVAAFMIAMYGLSSPESSFITVTSFIPFFAPMIMFLRVGMLALPLWEIALGIGVLVATIIVMALISAKVYRGGVLLYGKSFSLKDFKQALVLSKRERK